MPSDINQIEEERAGRLNQERNAANLNEDISEATSDNSRATLSFWEKMGKHWPILILAAIFDLFALIPFVSVVVNFCFAIIVFLYFGRKKIVSGVMAPMGIGIVIDFILSFFLISLWPACLATVVTRIALKETAG